MGDTRWRWGPLAWKLLHVTTPHYPTHAGRDARGPQNSAGPPNSGLTGIGGTSSWERRRPRRPMVIFIAIAWNEKRRVGAESLPSPVAMGATRGGWGPLAWKPHPCHNCPPTTPLPHAGEGAGAPRASHQPILARTRDWVARRSRLEQVEVATADSQGSIDGQDTCRHSSRTPGHRTIGLRCPRDRASASRKTGL